MTNDDMHLEQYENYAELFNPLRQDRQARRKRKPRPKHQPKKTQAEIVRDMADAVGLERGFETTYQPSLYEAGWLLQSLQTLYDQQLITDVLALVKGGKEASIYCCAAHASTGVSMLAAKVYRPRMFRQLRNDHVYRQGREVLMPDGPAINERNHREMRALTKKTAYGQHLQHSSWLLHEYQTLGQLHAAGGNVPRSWAAGDNVILMDYIGDEHMAAPTLNTVRLESEEVQPLFDDMLRNIELMLQQGIIHGDLSAYNVLYWEGELTLIDFPQVTMIRTNPRAHTILQRDIFRTCDYFARQGLACDPAAITELLWYRYGHGDPETLGRHEV